MNIVFINDRTGEEYHSEKTNSVVGVPRVGDVVIPPTKLITFTVTQVVWNYAHNQVSVYIMQKN